MTSNTDNLNFVTERISLGISDPPVSLKIAMEYTKFALHSTFFYILDSSIACLKMIAAKSALFALHKMTNRYFMEIEKCPRSPSDSVIMDTLGYCYDCVAIMNKL